MDLSLGVVWALRLSPARAHALDRAIVRVGWGDTCRYLLCLLLLSVLFLALVAFGLLVAFVSGLGCLGAIYAARLDYSLPAPSPFRVLPSRPSRVSWSTLCCAFCQGTFSSLLYFVPCIRFCGVFGLPVFVLLLVIHMLTVLLVHLCRLLETYGYLVIFVIFLVSCLRWFGLHRRASALGQPCWNCT